MGQRERFILFLVGVLVGVGLLFGINSRSQPERDRRRQVREALNLPGMMYDYAATSRGFYGHYVKHEAVESRPDGSKVRTIVTGGRRRYDAQGHELPEEHLLVRETYPAGVALAEPGPVSDYAFQFADRIALTLRPGRKAAEVALPSGDVAVSDAPDRALLRLTRWATAPGGPDWSRLADLLVQLRAHPAVASADFVTIDWRAESDVIRAESSR